MTIHPRLPPPGIDSDKNRRPGVRLPMCSAAGARRRHSVRAFTLVELLVVVAIIGLLISLLNPSLRTAQERSRAAVCSSNLRQLPVAARLYAHDQRDFLPDLTGWAHSDESATPWSLRTYLGLRPGTRSDPEMFFNTVLTCPSAMRFPGRSYWAYHRTYQLNEHLAGTVEVWNESRRQEWETTRASARRAPRYLSIVPTPSSAGIFFDAVSYRRCGNTPGGDIGDGPLPDNIYYRAYHFATQTGGGFHPMYRARTFHPHRMGASALGTIRMDDILNVAYLDGSVRGMTREETEQLPMDWQTKAFWGQ